jgi:hypothetical protein
MSVVGEELWLANRTEMVTSSNICDIKARSGEGVVVADRAVHTTCLSTVS